MSIFNLLLLVLCIGIGVAIMWIVLFKKNKFRYRIRMTTATKRYIRDDIGTVWKNKEKVKYVKLKRMKELIPLPPSEAIDIDDRGRKIVECYRDEVGNYSYIKDEGDVKFFNPIDTEMNVLLAEQVVKANDRNNGLLANMPMIIGLSFVVLVFLSTLLFLGDALKSLSDFTTASAEPILRHQENQIIIIDKLNQLDNDIQKIGVTLDIPEETEAPN